MTSHEGKSTYSGEGCISNEASTASAFLGVSVPKADAVSSVGGFPREAVLGLELPVLRA